MTLEEKKKLYAALSAPFTEEAIERTEGRVTGKGYDTSGIKYQYVVNRLNEVLGIGGYRTQQTVKVKEGTTAKGRQVFDATCEVVLQLGEWSSGQFQPFAESYGVGGHTSMNEADARKGAFTNGFKKAAAMLGCGKQAYEGSLDDDNVPAEQQGHTSRPVLSSPSAMRSNPPIGTTPPPSQAGRTGGAATQPTSDQPTGNITNKQLACIFALAKKLGYETSQFRENVKQKHGKLLEQLDSRTASRIIEQLSQRASNGHSHPVAGAEHADGR